ncbi:MAG: hypothetical protein HOP04_10920 [Methylophilaceae bacterium]|nr:hypothetical protein [Methylophilaceae bacterium]
MLAIASLAVIGYLATGADTKRVSGDVYAPKISLVENNIAKDYSQTKTHIPSLVALTNSTTISKARGLDNKAGDEILKAFNEIGLPPKEGIRLLEINKDFLGLNSYPVKKIEPITSIDLEEGATYLNVRLYIEADFEKVLELDYLMTKNLVKSTEYIPEKISFTVYNEEIV